MSTIESIADPTEKLKKLDSWWLNCQYGDHHETVSFVVYFRPQYDLICVKNPVDPNQTFILD